MKLSKVSIIGVGLLGGSIARDIRQHKLAEQVVGVCRSEKSAKLLAESGVVDKVASLAEAVKGADLIILATPMQTMKSILLKMVDLVNESATITDVGSVKLSLYKEVEHYCPTLLNQFVFAHPIAGGEHSGIEASKNNLFLSKHIVITPTPELQALHLDKVKGLWSQLGGKLVSMSLQQHDAIFARTSHLPHVIAYSLIHYLSTQKDNQMLFDLAASGFYDFTRIASSGAEMWRDICSTNKEEIVQALKDYQAEIQSITHHIENNEQEHVLSYFENAKKARDLGLEKKHKKANDEI